MSLIEIIDIIKWSFIISHCRFIFVNITLLLSSSFLALRKHLKRTFCPPFYTTQPIFLFQTFGLCDNIFITVFLGMPLIELLPQIDGGVTSCFVSILNFAHLHMLLLAYSRHPFQNFNFLTIHIGQLQIIFMKIIFIKHRIPSIHNFFLIHILIHALSKITMKRGIPFINLVEVFSCILFYMLDTQPVMNLRHDN